MRQPGLNFENKETLSQENQEIENDYAQCPCGRLIRSPKEYSIFLLNLREHEINVLCPNEGCYLGELGRIRFTTKGRSWSIEEASFNSFFLSWNSDRLGEERTKDLLESHLRDVIRGIDWPSVMDRLEVSR
jgi:hypothetical protein